jgi:hypothetical protein
VGRRYEAGLKKGGRIKILLFNGVKSLDGSAVSRMVRVIFLKIWLEGLENFSWFNLF